MPQISARGRFLLLTLLVQAVILTTMWLMTFHNIQSNMVKEFKQHTLWNNATLANQLIDTIIVDNAPVQEQIEAQRSHLRDLVQQVNLAGRNDHFIGLEKNATTSVLFLASIAAMFVIGFTFIATCLIARRYNEALEHLNHDLEDELKHRLEQGLQTRHALILGLAKLADYRDTDTGTHLDRICTYSCLLSEELRDQFDEIDDEWIECMRLAASLHDIGKVGIPDSVLLKSGALTDEERKIIEKHPLMGADTLMTILAKIGDDMLLNMSLQIALSHHEKWDGTGYPYGLAGDHITLPARIVALADVYDALTTKRVYKPAMPHEEARKIILDGRGSHFDPQVTDAFERIHEQFDTVRRLLQSGAVPDSSYRATAA